MEKHIPRAEYPRPEFARKDWMNLNGTWNFDFDDEDRGRKEHWECKSDQLQKKISVPFAYQAKLSGVEDKEMHDIVWYQREFQVPDAWKDRRIQLNFGAVDYSCQVWVNGKLAVTHEGGHTPFSADITDLLEENNVLTVRAQDYAKDITLPRGKQYWEMESKYIFYTGTTGIWQTVWLEPVHESRLERITFRPDIDHNQVQIGILTKGISAEKNLRVRMKVCFSGWDVEQVYDKAPISTDTYEIKENWEYRCMGLKNVQLDGFEYWWTPERPNLYVVTASLYDGDILVDEVETYFGMRKISMENGVLCLNNKPYKQRLVLDQGYFPMGGLTAPTDEELKEDILLGKAMGFNGARKHQKIEDPRWLYWCDHLGYLVWGEMANAYDYSKDYAEKMMKEWVEGIRRDYNHPCIVAWVPLNESWGVPNVKKDVFQQNHARAMYYITKSLDDTRPVGSNDGWEHVCSDICTIHDYAADQNVLEKRYESIANMMEFRPSGREIYVAGASYHGEPIMVTEFGGIAYQEDESGWGYSNAKSQDDFEERLKAVLEPIKKSKWLSGFCYTQLTDVEQEMNGLLTYDRKPKLPLEVIKKIVEG